MTDTWDDDDRIVLSHLPFDEVAPPEDLEARVVSEALRRRPARGVDIERARRRRRAQVRWAAVGAAIVAAAVIVGVLVVDMNSTTQPTRASIQTVSVHQADVDAALTDPATRTGSFTGEGLTGKAALERDGRGFLYDLAVSPNGSGTAWLWLQTSSGATVRVGPLPPPLPRDVEFTVHGDVENVRGLIVSRETNGIEPSAPGAQSATALLR